MRLRRQSLPRQAQASCARVLPPSGKFQLLLLLKQTAELSIGRKEGLYEAVAGWSTGKSRTTYVPEGKRGLARKNPYVRILPPFGKVSSHASEFREIKHTVFQYPKIYCWRCTGSTPLCANYLRKLRSDRTRTRTRKDRSMARCDAESRFGTLGVSNCPLGAGREDHDCPRCRLMRSLLVVLGGPVEIARRAQSHLNWVLLPTRASTRWRTFSRLIWSSLNLAMSSLLSPTCLWSSSSRLWSCS